MKSLVNQAASCDLRYIQNSLLSLMYNFNRRMTLLNHCILKTPRC